MPNRSYTNYTNFGPYSSITTLNDIEADKLTAKSMDVVDLTVGGLDVSEIVVGGGITTGGDIDAQNITCATVSATGDIDCATTITASHVKCDTIDIGTVKETTYNTINIEQDVLVINSNDPALKTTLEPSATGLKIDKPLDVTGDILVSGTVDGRDVALDGTNQDTHISDDTKHRIINDATATTTELWSGSKINTELTGKAPAVHADHPYIKLTNPTTTYLNTETATRVDFQMRDTQPNVETVASLTHTDNLLGKGLTVNGFVKSNSMVVNGINVETELDGKVNNIGDEIIGGNKTFSGNLISDPAGEFFWKGQNIQAFFDSKVNNIGNETIAGDKTFVNNLIIDAGTGELTYKGNTLQSLLDGAGGAAAMAELTDVDLTGLIDNYKLYYDETAGKWKVRPDGDHEQVTVGLTGTGNKTITFRNDANADGLLAYCVACDGFETNKELYVPDVNFGVVSIKESLFDITPATAGVSFVAGDEPTFWDNGAPDFSSKITVAPCFCSYTINTILSGYEAYQLSVRPNSADPASSLTGTIGKRTYMEFSCDGVVDPRAIFGVVMSVYEPYPSPNDKSWYADWRPNGAYGWPNVPMIGVRTLPNKFGGDLLQRDVTQLLNCPDITERMGIELRFDTDELVLWNATAGTVFLTQDQSLSTEWQNVKNGTAKCRFFFGGVSAIGTTCKIYNEADSINFGNIGGSSEYYMTGGYGGGGGASETLNFKIYDKVETDLLLLPKADIANHYNKTQIDAQNVVLNNSINLKADQSTTYTKLENDAQHVVINNAINLKANISDVYDKTAVDAQHVVINNSITNHTDHTALNITAATSGKLKTTTAPEMAISTQGSGEEEVLLIRSSTTTEGRGIDVQGTIRSGQARITNITYQDTGVDKDVKTEINLLKNADIALDNRIDAYDNATATTITNLQNQITNNGGLAASIIAGTEDVLGTTSQTFNIGEEIALAVTEATINLKSIDAINTCQLKWKPVESLFLQLNRPIQMNDTSGNGQLKTTNTLTLYSDTAGVDISAGTNATISAPNEIQLNTTGSVVSNAPVHKLNNPSGSLIRNELGELTIDTLSSNVYVSSGNALYFTAAGDINMNATGNVRLNGTTNQAPDPILGGNFTNVINFNYMNRVRKRESIIASASGIYNFGSNDVGTDFHLQSYSFHVWDGFYLVELKTGLTGIDKIGSAPPGKEAKAYKLNWDWNLSAEINTNNGSQWDWNRVRLELGSDGGWNNRIIWCEMVYTYKFLY